MNKGYTTYHARLRCAESLLCSCLIDLYGLYYLLQYVRQVKSLKASEVTEVSILNGYILISLTLNRNNLSIIISSYYLFRLIITATRCINLRI